MVVTENKDNMWVKMLKEEFQVTDPYTLNWVSEYANRHAIKESATLGAAAVGGPVQAPATFGQGLPGENGVSPLYATPLNTLGMGNPMAPSQLNPNSATPADFFNQRAGSGDIPVSTLPMALNIALLTVGLELLPVVPSKGPWHLLTYLDFPYAGGKLGKRNEIAGLDGVGEGRENKPLYFKVVLPMENISEARKSGLFVANQKYEISLGEDQYVVTGVFKGFGRMDGSLLMETVSCVSKADGANVSLAEAFSVSASGAVVADEAWENTLPITGAKVDFVQTSVDLIDGFANFATGRKEGMTRAQNETGTGNVIGLRLFSKWVSMVSYEVTATVTRQQLQDLPLYGVDAVSQVMEACQNEITQHLNQRITTHVRELGVTNAISLRAIQGVDLNLWMGTSDTTMAAMGIEEYKDVYGVDHKQTWGAIANSEVNTSAENLHTRQRRVMSRILAAANLVQVTSRRGRPTWILTNAQVATMLQDASGFVIAPMVNNMAQDGSQNLYMSGQIAGLKLYVDPYMSWEDCRITIGRKGNTNEPGCIFMPYILADTVSITAEGTMAPKMLVNSRFQIVDAGFFPEKNYYTFCVGSEFGLI